MTITVHNFITAIQRALPQARVYWEQEPDLFFTEQPCTLTAIGLSDPNKKRTLHMPKGIGQEPLDDVVQRFVDYFNAP